MKKDQVRIKGWQLQRIRFRNLLWGACLLSMFSPLGVMANEKQSLADPEFTQETKRIISGSVREKGTGESLPGVNILILKGKTHLTGTVTDIDGNFRMIIPEEADVLTVSMIGYENQLITLSDKLEFKIFLNSSVEQIDEVVITGIFNNKAKESFTGAATFITKDELKKFENRDILKTIGNIDPSFNIVLNEEIGSDPNKLPDINIRGTSSVSSGQLSLSDGLGVEDDFENLKDDQRVELNIPLFVLDGFEITLERMMDLNQDEIESVTILKDASATAIYGSRGANGVVVLTSVKPEEGKLQVTYKGGFNVEVPDLRSYNLLDAREKLELERLAGLYDSDNFETQLQLKRAYNEKLRLVMEGVNTYWLSKPVQIGLGQSHGVGLSGGTSSFRYRLNFQYRNTSGVMKGSDRNNFNGTINLTYLLKNLRFTNSLTLGFNNSENSQYGAFSSYTRLNPYWKTHDEDGNLVQQFGLGDPILSPRANPLYDASLGSFDKREYTNINENLNIEWDVNEYLKVSGRLGYSKNSATSDKFTSPENTRFIGKADELRGKYVLTFSESTTLSSQMTLSYGRAIGDHRFYAGLNGQLRESQRTSYGLTVTGFAHDRLSFISMGTQYSGDTPFGSEGVSRSVGLTSNFNYTYDNTYYVDLSYRLDGASSFGRNSRFAPFYSIGAGWNVNRMKFVQEKLPSISNLRLKYSYGVTGSLQFSPYEAMTTYEYLSGDDRYNGNLGTYMRKVGNPDLEWQTTYQHNVGLDLSLWQNLISLSTNYYYKRTKDLITQVSLPLSNGYSTYTENMGDVLNEGLELNITLRLLKENKSRPGWNMTGGLSHNKNKLLRLSEAMKEISRVNEELSGNTSPSYLYREGESMNTLYVTPSLGIDPATGKEMFVGADGKPTYEYPTNYKVPYGSMQPKVNGRLSSNLMYKNLRLNLGFSFRLGASVYNSTLANKVETTDLTGNVDDRVLTDRWQKPGDQTLFKGLNNTEPTYITSRLVYKERTLLMNTLSLDYQVPREWVKKHLKASRLTLNYTTNDLLYFSTIKQERGIGYPFAWRHSLSLNIGF